MDHEKPDLNVYGHNLPEDRGTVVPGIREKQAGTVKGGGLPAGQRERRLANPQHAVDEHPELAETPMPPRHAPLSDEVPS